MGRRTFCALLVTIGLIAFGFVGAPAQASAPGNDNFSSAYVLTGPSGEVGGTNVGAATETDEPGHPVGPYASVWYTWTAPFSGDVSFSTCGSSFDTLMAAYTGTALNALTEVASNDDSGSKNPFDGGGCGVQAEIGFAAVNGTQYSIAVDGFTGDTGSIKLLWNSVPPPANDDFANAQALSGHNGSLAGRNLSASVETNEPGHPDGPSQSVWYSFTATQNSNVHFETCGFELAAYTGSAVDALTELASSSADSFFCPSVDFAVQNGTQYFIAVDSGFEGAGKFTLTWTDQFRPDAKIKRSSASSFVGNDEYLSTFAVVLQKVKRGGAAIFTLQFENDGSVPDTFDVFGCPGFNGYKVTYFDGSADVTFEVTSGGYTTPTLNPGQSKDLTMKVKAGPRAHKSYGCGVDVESEGFLAFTSGFSGASDEVIPIVKRIK